MEVNEFDTSAAVVSDDTGAPAAEPARRRCRMRFTGTGSEYFRIWIVNLLLTIVTLGIYSAWAKVRKLRYVYRNTQLDGSVFDYHGEPLAILKGRLLAVLLLALYNVAIGSLGTYALVAMAALMLALPWLLTQSYRFRLRNSSYRGLRFRFEGPAWHLHVLFGLPMVLVLAPGLLASGSARPDGKWIMLLGLGNLLILPLVPYLHYRFKRWQHGHAWYGTQAARFTAGASDFYVSYIAAAFLALFIGVPALMIAAGRLPPAGLVFVVLMLYAGGLGAFSYVSASLHNAIWSGTRFGDVQLEARLSPLRMIGLMFGNAVMIVCSLGLLTPFAAIRLIKARVESVEVLDADALQRFAGDARLASVAATGESAVDLLNLDFGL